MADLIAHCSKTESSCPFFWACKGQPPNSEPLCNSSPRKQWQPAEQRDGYAVTVQRRANRGIVEE